MDAWVRAAREHDCIRSRRDASGPYMGHYAGGQSPHSWFSTGALSSGGSCGGLRRARDVGPRFGFVPTGSSPPPHISRLRR